MKFKKGCLVIITGAAKGCEMFLGTIHVLGSRYEPIAGAWDFDPPAFHPSGGEVCGEEHRMRVIENPGDDAQDESLSWKKVPSTEKREELQKLPCGWEF